LWLSLVSTLASEHSSISMASEDREDHTETLSDCAADADGNMHGQVMVQLQMKNKIMNMDPEDEFDCAAGVHNWHDVWSDAKQEWCCKHEGVGCLYNCTEGAVKNWTQKKADWCCANELLGCGFNCSAGYSQRKLGWSKLKTDYCCQNELVACTFNCSEDSSNMTPSSLAIKKAWCCKAEGTKCKEEEKNKRPCLTQENVLAKSSMFGGHVSPAGTPCVFGLDPQDEGYHCTLDKGRYGSFGWCYTNKDRSSWGACNQDCPLFGLAKIIGDRLKAAQKDLGDRLKHLEGQLKDQQKTGNSTNALGHGADAKSGKKGNAASSKNSTEKNADNGAKNGANKGSAEDSKKDSEKDSNKDSEKHTKKDSSNSNDAKPGKKGNAASPKNSMEKKVENGAKNGANEGSAEDSKKDSKNSKKDSKKGIP